ncbi:uncharacterized protein LOC129594388 [Paramacrobiotus metropolitanus]|uniref:uncharacterized protein LOC129594388 n=1 Tax=Paramacrobiotus metropolitanus TaxID=2943436 RepID=UPI002445E14D|nr:uncharacterized protein LOC129594388 [Paramacrobiotus metropolitanus]
MSENSEILLTGTGTGMVPQALVLSGASGLSLQASLVSAGNPAGVGVYGLRIQSATCSTLNKAYRKPKGKKRVNQDEEQDGEKPSRKQQPPNEETLKKLRNIVEVNPYNHTSKESHDAWCKVVLLSREQKKNSEGQLVADASPVLSKEILSIKALVRRNMTRYNERHVRITGTEEEWEEWDRLMEQIKEYSECVPLSTRDPEKAAREAGLQARTRVTQLGMRSGTTKESWDIADEEQDREDFEMDMGLTDHPDELAAKLQFDDNGRR